MELYVVRHGQTEWNAQNRVCGRTDIPLTAKGEEQARAIAASLADRHFDAIIASPLARARRTAEIIANARGVHITKDDRLIEQHYGFTKARPAMTKHSGMRNSNLPQNCPAANRFCRSRTGCTG
ncbi:putative phosphoglycerate mutase/uncharacterized phosphatase [Paenibacillus methanolicus]|uniref:Putative phosphoglycerate mutase/uncharacterized phosphatase n=1 Tax=Paenibacillus methanolicus TaxID=582686 RepID=A0A5S5CDU9_9BACL|nr:putative phosphoglycerate mutase/uncharacterized phosphatase [Paenibacillus methanolicus]